MGQPSSGRDASLDRRLGLPMLTFWGVGTIIGGGFYALIGEVAAKAGVLTPAAFLAASVIASFSALSFAELSARLPYSAGEARYVLDAFGNRTLSGLVGWMVITTGVVSAATLANAFARFADTLVGAPPALTTALFVLGLGAIAAWGIGQSVIVAAVITVIETCGLVLVVVLASPKLGHLGTLWSEAAPSAFPHAASGVLLGAFIAFYSFVGFEDMVNLAEEVREPARTMPLAIVLSLGFATLIYVVVSVTVIAAVPLPELAGSKAPLSLAVQPESPMVAQGLTLVGMLAGLNGALVQIVMAARVAYGMAQHDQAPNVFSRINERSRTPLTATAAASVTVLALALFFPLVTLAKITSGVLLLIYAVVNLSLLRIKLRGDPIPQGPCYPRWVPATGALLCLTFLLFQLSSQ